MRRFVFLVLFAYGAASAFGLDRMPPIQLPRDDWYRIELMNHHVGWMRLFSEETTYEDKPAIRVRSDFVIRMLRSGTRMELNRVRVAYFASEPPFAAFAFTMSSDESGFERRVEGVTEDGVMRMTTYIDGRESETSVPIAPGTLFEEAVPYFLNARRTRVGDAVDAVMFNSDLMRPMGDRVVAEGSETLTLSGEPVDTLVVRHTLDWMDGVHMTEWYDADGSLAQTEVDTLGVPMRVTRASRRQATDLENMGDLDVILATKLVVQGGMPINRERFLAEVRLTEGDIIAAIPATMRQTLDRHGDDGWTTLDIRRDPTPIGSMPFPVEDAEWSQFLTPTVYVESDDAAIRAAAAEATADATDAWDAASRISRWVYRHITDKSLDKGFATAKQTLDSRVGDCTEHTMLAVAMSRAVGIPARILAGVVWQRDAFYYHFWLETFVGEWVALDPTLGQTPADARHIQLSGGTLESETAMELSEGILRTLNRVELRLPHDSPSRRYVD